MASFLNQETSEVFSAKTKWLINSCDNDRDFSVHFNLMTAHLVANLPSVCVFLLMQSIKKAALLGPSDDDEGSLARSWPTFFYTYWETMPCGRKTYVSITEPKSSFGKLEIGVCCTLVMVQAQIDMPSRVRWNHPFR